MRQLRTPTTNPRRTGSSRPRRDVRLPRPDTAQLRAVRAHRSAGQSATVRVREHHAENNRCVGTSSARASATISVCVTTGARARRSRVSMVCGLDLHRRQITFDAMDTMSGEVWRGRVWQPDRDRVRRWLRDDLARRAGGQPVAMVVEGCTGGRYVVEEIEAAGLEAHVAEPADTQAARGRKHRAKTDRSDVRLLRELLQHGELPESWIHRRRPRQRAVRVLPLRPSSRPPGGDGQLLHRQPQGRRQGVPADLHRRRHPLGDHADRHRPADRRPHDPIHRPRCALLPASRSVGTGRAHDNGPEWIAGGFQAHLARKGIAHHRIPPRSPNHNAVCERVQGTALQECWRPASTVVASPPSASCRPRQTPGCCATTTVAATTATTCAAAHQLRSSTTTAPEHHDQQPQGPPPSPRPPAWKI